MDKECSPVAVLDMYPDIPNFSYTLQKYNNSNGKWTVGKRDKPSLETIILGAPTSGLGMC